MPDKAYAPTDSQAVQSHGVVYSGMTERYTTTVWQVISQLIFGGVVVEWPSTRACYSRKL